LGRKCLEKAVVGGVSREPQAVDVATSEGLIKSFDRLRTNGDSLVPFVVSLSNHRQIRLEERLPKSVRRCLFPRVGGDPIGSCDQAKIEPPPMRGKFE
jgi:hypothetical protein